MAWASKKQYAILMNSEEGKDLIQDLPNLSQDDFQIKFGEIIGKSGASYNKDEDEDYKEDKDVDDLPWWDKPDEDEVKEAYGDNNEDEEYDENEDPQWAKAEELIKDTKEFKEIVESQRRFEQIMENENLGDHDERYKLAEKVQLSQQANYEKLENLLEKEGIDLDEVDITQLVEEYVFNGSSDDENEVLEEKTFNENGIRKAGKDENGATVYDLNENALSSNEFKEILYDMGMNPDYALEEYLFEKGENPNSWKVTDKTRELINMIYKIK